MTKSNQQHLAAVKQLFDEVYSNGHLAVLDKIFTPDVKYHDPATPNIKKGLPGLKETECMYKNAFPTRNFKIDHLLCSGDDCIIAHWTCQGTHKGTYLDIPPSGKSFKTTGISIYKFSGNKISEVIQIWDRLGLLEQLGLSAHSYAGHD